MVVRKGMQMRDSVEPRLTAWRMTRSAEMKRLASS